MPSYSFNNPNFLEMSFLSFNVGFQRNVSSTENQEEDHSSIFSLLIFIFVFPGTHVAPAYRWTDWQRRQINDLMCPPVYDAGDAKLF